MNGLISFQGTFKSEPLLRPYASTRKFLVIAYKFTSFKLAVVRIGCEVRSAMNCRADPLLLRKSDTVLMVCVINVSYYRRNI